MNQIRVLRLIDRLNVGGPALQATVLSEGLDPARFDQRLLAGAIEPNEGDYAALRAPDLPVQRVAGLGRSPRLGGDVQAFAEISRTIRSFRPHIVHTHKAKAGVLGRLAAWTHHVPATVHHFHGHLLHGYFSPLKTRGVVSIERALAWRTTRLVAVGAQVRDELTAAGVGKRRQYVVVPPGVRAPGALDTTTARVALDLPTSGHVVAFVGRLASVKRPERFVEVARDVQRRNPNSTFAIAGDGELLAAMQAAARDLGDRMRFLGWRADVETVYAASDVVVLTSDNEGMPVSLIEAAICGVPAVTTRVGSAHEVVLDGVTGFVTALDVEELAAATLKLLGDNELRARMGASANVRARALFSADRLVADISSLYEQIARDLGFD